MSDAVNTHRDAQGDDYTRLETDPGTMPGNAPGAMPGAMDASALQAFASIALAKDEPADGSARRGPFRPEVWMNARQRHASRLAVHYFRAFDVLAIVAITLLCSWAASPMDLMQTEFSRILPYALGALTTLGLLRSLGLYRFASNQKPMLHLTAVSAVAVVGGITAMMAGWLARGNNVELTGLMVWSCLSLLAIYILHMIWSDMVSRWRANGALVPNIVVVGATRHAERLIREALKRRDLNVLGVFDDRLARSPEAIEGVPVLGGSNDLLSHRMLPYVDRIVLALDPRAQTRVRELTQRLETLPNEVTLLVDPHNEAERNAALEKLARAPLAPLSNGHDDDRRAFNKRLQDLIIGLIALIGLAPVMALVALAVRLDSPGPIFFRQRRHGFNQEEVLVWKFRSMRHEAADATASRQVTTDDDRITRVGKILRSTSLDELPQLWNVFKGEMSLVGPRPHAIGMKTGQIESARLVGEYAHRHRIKPGMTGWAAIHGSRGPLHTAQDVRRRVQLDIDYVERQSFWLDIWIMVVTIPVLLGDRMAVR